MITHVENKAEFERIIGSSELVLVDFWATWCGPCRMLGSVLEEYSSENPDVEIVKIDVDVARDLASEYDVQSLPTVVIFKNGKIADTKVGFLSKSVLEKFISENK